MIICLQNASQDGCRERQREQHERLWASSSDLEQYKKKVIERKIKHIELCAEELETMRKRGREATRRWRACKSTPVSCNISSSDLPSHNVDTTLLYKSPASFVRAKFR